MGTSAVFTILVCLVYIGLSLRVPLEEVAFLNGVPDCRLRLRSHAATNVETVWLFEGETVSFYFCLTSPDDVIISDLLYSNDGGSDVITIAIDSDVIGEVNTTDQSSYGELWNEFYTSGQIGKGTYSTGKHILYLTITEADQFGVELDTIVIKFARNFTTNGFSFCDLTSKGIFRDTSERCHPAA